MKTKKLIVIFIAIAFILSAISAGIFVFALKKIDIDFEVSENFDTKAITQTLDEFNGKNLLFFNLNSVYESLEQYTNIKVTSVEKKMPNVISVKIEERVTLYNLYLDGVTYNLDGEGYVTGCQDGQVEAKREIISLALEGITVSKKDCGSIIETSNDKLLYSAIEMVKSVNLTDCIKKVTLKEDSTGEMRDASFETYSGVTIVVYKADEDGTAKIEKAFNSYDSVSIDFVKSYSEIEVYKQDDGEIKVVWKS